LRDDEAKYYDEGVRSGRTLVTVHEGDDYEEGRAERLFDETSAERYRSGRTTTVV
jgi:hypothetical protein